MAQPIFVDLSNLKMIGMNTDTDYLKLIAEEIVLNSNTNLSKPNPHLQTEAKRLEKAITCYLTISAFDRGDTCQFTMLNKIVNICDNLFDHTGSISPDVQVIIDLLVAVRHILPSHIRPTLQLPKAFLLIQNEQIEKSLDNYLQLWRQNGVDPKLIAIASIPFKRFTECRERLCWSDYTWLKGYQAKLAIMDWDNADCNSKTEALTSLLIGRDFNDDRFYIYCKKYIKHRTDKIAGKSKRLLEYALCEKLVLEDTQVNMPSFDLRANTLSTRLTKWIMEEIDFVETHEREAAYAKLHFNLYVNRVAFFFKLLHEQKLFGDTSFKELSQQIAGTCLSQDGEEIQAGTIISKAYPKDQKMLEEMEKLLVGMLGYVRSFMRGR